MFKYKISISLLLLFIGLLSAFLTYDLRTNYTHIEGKVIKRLGYVDKYTSKGVESANNGVAVGLSIISGFSLLSSTLLLSSINKTKEKV